jgi:putative protein-disulfide isomerase
LYFKPILRKKPGIKLFSSDQQSRIHPQEETVLAEPIVKDVSITYYTDPLCVWSLAFEPHWLRLYEALREDVSFSIKMGGLIYSNAIENNSPYASPQSAIQYMEQVAHQTGVQYVPTLWLNHDVQSSYPCSIAYQASVDEPFEKRMLLLRQLRQDALIEGNYHTLESEFYDLIQKLEMDKSKFSYYWQSGKAYKEFMINMASNNILGVHSFPTLSIHIPGKTTRFLHGYHHYYKIKRLIHNFCSDLHFSPLPHPIDFLKKFQPLTEYELMQVFDLSPEMFDDFIEKNIPFASIKVVNGLHLYFYGDDNQ